jgi:hypothetical protein
MNLVMSLSATQKYIYSNCRLIGLTVLFAFFLTPFSLDVRNDRVSVNYLFIFFPVIALIFGQRLQLPSKIIQTLMGIYISIFLICTIYQYEYLQFWDRRFISFVLFMSMFTFFFIKIDEEMGKAFKYAIILVSIIYSMTSIFQYFYYGGAKIGYGAMLGLVQSQRYGFILLFGFWLIFFEKTTTQVGFFIKIVLLAVIFNGLGLTFSRSSVAGLIVSSGCGLLILIYVNKLYILKNILQRNIIFLILSCVIVIMIVSISYHLIPDYFQYFSQRLLKTSITPHIEYIYFADSYFAAYDTNEYFYKDTSEGFRIFMIGEVFNYLTKNPFFGSGYLGVWVMFDDLSGASHNQLLDVLFRTGMVGFLGFIYLFYRIIKYNFRVQNWAVLVSLAGILVIGFFHETFKLSQGAFVFAFLAAQSFEKRWPA